MYFAVKRGEIRNRFDVTYNNPILRQKLNSLARGPFPLVELGSLLSENNGIRYGTGTPPLIVEPSEASVPFIRATDIKNGEILTENLLHVEKNQARNMKKCLVETGEMILVRSGVNTGDCAIIPNNLAGSYAAYDLILHFLDSVNPAFVSTFLETETGRSQLNVLKGRSAQPHLNAQEVSSIYIPNPPTNIQNNLAANIEEARIVRRKQLEQANTLLNSLDDYLLKELGLTPLLEDKRSVFAINLKQMKGRRFDPPAYRPYYTKDTPPITPTKRLSEIANIDPNRAKKPENDEVLVPYVGLPECELNYVREVVLRPYREVKGRSIVRPGDILFARIEPSIFNKKYVLVDDLKGYDYAYTSTEFYVVHTKNDEVEQAYLYAMFFCSFVFAQIKGKTTGSSGRRRISPDLFATLQIPVPEDKNIQVTISNEIMRRRKQAKQLQEKALAEWEAAKIRFEQELFGKGI